ncbi:unnamed protein product [Brugia timori]|uniref:Uncharacterized protein n=1 Tax=Brugia timori TaxID=42155 RepID=A0A3P7UPS8_9BILA|nr:unnamed protein product [Brugia timori]
MLSVGCADEQQRNGIICEMKTNIKHKSSVMSTYHASKESDSKKYLVLSLGRTVVFGGQYHFFFEGHSKCMMKMKCGDKTALVDIAVAICPGSNQISVAFGKKMHSEKMFASWTFSNS